MKSRSSLSLKVDVCTHDGMRDGVPRLLDLLARHRVQASFFLSFGPDNSGKAVFNVFRPGFVRKMVKSSAPSMYGLRTMLSGTLLPARPIAMNHPDLVRRIEGEGHEVAVHAWDHRRWQDHLEEMDEREIESHYHQAFEAYQRILGHAPRAVGAAAWIVTPRSLRVADSLGLSYASDLRGGPACRLTARGEELRTPQFPTTGRCVEELLASGMRDDAELESALMGDMQLSEPAVLAVHAEVEGGPFLSMFDRLLPRLKDWSGEVRTLGDVARSLPRESLPLRELAYTPLPGRSGRVATSAEVQPA